MKKYMDYVYILMFIVGGGLADSPSTVGTILAVSLILISLIGLKINSKEDI